MKKIILAIALGVMLVALVAPGVSLAQGEQPPEFCTMKTAVENCGGVGETVGSPNSGATNLQENWGMCCLVNSVYNVTNWIFYLLMIIVVVMVVVGGATYMLSAGNPERAGKGKSIIIYGIVGLVIALLARLIPSIVKLVVGMG